MTHPTASLRGISVPRFMYGTAWKEERTKELTAKAIEAGFRAIDTANQRRHYVEALVGEAVREAIAEGTVRRDELFLQTKFTFVPGQDHRLPYDPRAPIAEQVAQSFASSLEHLGTDVIDSYVLHGPSGPRGIGAADREAWAAMEALQRAGKTRLLGVSNVSLSQLEALTTGAEVTPAFVQNRCFARTGWDREVRGFCARNQMLYQGFSLLTANDRELFDPRARRIAQASGRSMAQVVFRFALQVGMLPLTGTSDVEHMREDLAALDFELGDADVATLERIAG
jgi:diketogulonate reductase-like aldo/keto reductase